MKRFVLIVLLLSLIVFGSFAAESDEVSAVQQSTPEETVPSAEKTQPEKKIKVTRRGPSTLTADLGGMLYVPLNSDSAKGIGVMFGGTITPIGIKSMSLGFRAEGYLFAGKGIVNSDNKKHELKVGFSGTFIANYPLAKSFEVFAGLGAGFIFEDFESFTDFGQIAGFVVQGGGRGRLNNHIGVGAQVNVMFDVPNETRHLSLLGYFSIEL